MRLVDLTGAAHRQHQLVAAEVGPDARERPDASASAVTPRPPAGRPDDRIADREAEHAEAGATTTAASRNEFRLFAEIWS